MANSDENFPSLDGITQEKTPSQAMTELAGMPTTYHLTMNSDTDLMSEGRVRISGDAWQFDGPGNHMPSVGKSIQAWTVLRDEPVVVGLMMNPSRLFIAANLLTSEEIGELRRRFGLSS